MTTREVRRGLQAFYRSGEAGRRGPRVAAVQRLGSGFEADIFAFSLRSAAADGGEDQELVVRLAAGEGAGEKAAREFAALRRLRAAGYPVPEVFGLQLDGFLPGRPMLVMERIRGVSLGAGCWSPVPAERRDAQALLWRLMARLHALAGGAILPDSPLAPRSRDLQAGVEYELATLNALLGRLEGEAPASLRQVLAWLGARRASVAGAPLVVVHGDFHGNNVLLRADGAPFVIDWSNVRLADYRSELAWTRLLTRAHAEPDGGAALLRQYERLAGRQVAQLEYFEVAAGARLLLSVLISLRFGATRQGMRAEAAALMRRDTDHLGYVVELLEARTGLGMPDLEGALAKQLASVDGEGRGRRWKTCG